MYESGLIDLQVINTPFQFISDHRLLCLLHIVDLHSGIHKEHVRITEYFVSFLSSEDHFLWNLLLLRSNPRLLFCHCLPG